MADLKKIILAVLVGLILIPWPSDAQAKDDKVIDLFHGSFSNRYRLRTTGSDSDQDWESIFTLDIGDVNKQKVTGAIQAGGLFDLDGNNSDQFRDLYNTYSSQAVGRLYYAHIDVQNTWPFQTLRIGRQHNYDFENFYFDGMSFDAQPFYGVKISSYYGVPVHLSESQFGFENGDWLFGSAVTWTPINKIRLRFDYAHLKDRTSGFRVSAGDQEDNLLGTTLWVDITKNLDFYSRFTSFSDQVRDLTFASSFKLPKHQFRVQARYYRLLKGYDIRVPELDDYSILGTYQPYSEYALTVTKGFGKHFGLDGGFNWRKLDNVQTTSPFNHGYKRGYLSLSTYDLGVKGLSLTATGDYYKGEDSTFQNDNFGASFSASQQLLKKKLKISAGTAYYLYKFNYATANESTNVQTYFAKVEAKLSKKLKVKSGYEFEHNDLNGFHTFKLGLTWDF